MTRTLIREQLALAVSRTFVRYRRSSTCDGKECPKCAQYHAMKISYFIARDAPVRFVLPAFPAKSPNRAKTLGPLPDFAEELALEFLHDLCLRVKDIYSPGARIIIASDGRVFSDLIYVPDRDVTVYQTRLREIIDQFGASTLDLFNLEDVIELSSFASMREQLVSDYASPIDAIKKQIRTGGEPLSLYRGITRFLFEDARGLFRDRSNTALQRDARKRAYRVIQRSAAWGALVAKQYPKAVRLSIHPQACSSPKLGIHMVSTRDNWLTPWHGVIMATPVGFSLVKRATAERLGARLVMMSGRPSLYISRRIPVVDGTQPYGPSSVHHSGSLLVPDVADTDPSAPVERIAFEATSHGP